MSSSVAYGKLPDGLTGDEYVYALTHGWDTSGIKIVARSSDRRHGESVNDWEKRMDEKYKFGDGTDDDQISGTTMLMVGGAILIGILLIKKL